MTFQEQVVTNFDFLFKDDLFKIAKYPDDELADFMVVAVGNRLSLKFIKDRADFFLDISSNSTSEKWVNFYKVLGQLKEKGILKQDFKPSNQINSVRGYLKKYLNLILENADQIL